MTTSPTTRRFDSDPDALTWARAKVQHQIDRLRKFEQESTGPDQQLQWRKIANLLQREFIGGEGCVIAAFDVRRPAYTEMLANVAANTVPAAPATEVPA